MCAWNNEDMTLGCWINGLEDKDFLVPRAMMDICDCLVLVLNDGAKLALFVEGVFVEESDRFGQDLSQTTKEPRYLEGEIETRSRHIYREPSGL